MKIYLQLFFVLLNFSIYGQQCTEAILLTTSEFKKEVTQKNVQLVDVRSADEFQQGHIEKAILADIYHKNIFQEKLKSFNKEQAIYIYCRSGNRSKYAAKLLCQMGFKKVYDLKGGYLTWN